MGTGKANEVPDAIRKNVEYARKNVFEVPIIGTTIPHAVNGQYGAGCVFMHPASEGTGVISLVVPLVLYCTSRDQLVAASSCART